MNRIEVLLSFLRDDPNDSFTRFALASEYRAAGRPEEAVSEFEALVRVDPAYVGTYYHLAKTYETIGRTDKAIATYRAGIAEATRLRDAHARSELQAALMEIEGKDDDG